MQWQCHHLACLPGSSSRIRTASQQGVQCAGGIHVQHDRQLLADAKWGVLQAQSSLQGTCQVCNGCTAVDDQLKLPTSSSDCLCSRLCIGSCQGILHCILRSCLGLSTCSCSCISASLQQLPGGCTCLPRTNKELCLRPMVWLRRCCHCVKFGAYVLLLAAQLAGCKWWRGREKHGCLLLPCVPS